MKNERRASIAAAAFCAVALTAGAALADVAGTWRTISDEDGTPRGLIEITETGDRLSGRVAGSLVPGKPATQLCPKCPGDKKNKPLLGMEILWGFKPDPRTPGKWVDGKILDPETGSVYSANLTLAPDGKSLTLRGYVGHPTFGRSQTWLREK